MKKVLLFVLALALWLALAAPAMALRPSEIEVPGQASKGAEEANAHQGAMTLLPGASD